MGTEEKRVKFDLPPEDEQMEEFLDSLISLPKEPKLSEVIGLLDIYQEMWEDKLLSFQSVQKAELNIRQALVSFAVESENKRKLIQAIQILDTVYKQATEKANILSYNEEAVSSLNQLLDVLKSFRPLAPTQLELNRPATVIRGYKYLKSNEQIPSTVALGKKALAIFGFGGLLAAALFGTLLVIHVAPFALALSIVVVGAVGGITSLRKYASQATKTSAGRPIEEPPVTPRDIAQVPIAPKAPVDVEYDNFSDSGIRDESEDNESQAGEEEDDKDSYIHLDRRH